MLGKQPPVSNSPCTVLFDPLQIQLLNGSRPFSGVFCLTLPVG